MALRPIDRYPSQIDVNADYPHGKARNAGSFQDGTGTPYEKDVVNDLFGLQQALLVAASITPSGTPDSATVSQYLDAIRSVARHVDLRSRLALRLLDDGGVTIGSAASGGVASVSDGRTRHVKAGASGAFVVYDSAVIDAASVATVPSLTSIESLARGGTRLLVVGNGGNNNASSVDDGASWLGGGALGGTPFPSAVVWDGTEFIAVDPVNVTAHSTNGSVWTPPTGDDVTDVMYVSQGGLAVLTGGIAVAGGLSAPVGGDQVFATTSDHGVNWIIAGSIPSTDYVALGRLAGDGGSEIYWLGKVDAVDQLDLWVSNDAVTWEKRAELEGFGSQTSIRLHVCPDTGLLVATQDAGSFLRVAASGDRGHSWCEPVPYLIASNSSIQVANGRIFAFASGAVFATDRLL